MKKMAKVKGITIYLGSLRIFLTRISEFENYFKCLA